MDIISALIPSIKSGDAEKFRAALSKFREPRERYTLPAFKDTPIAEYDCDNCHVVIRTVNGELCFTIWEKIDFGYIVHAIVHKVTAEYTFDQIPF